MRKYTNKRGIMRSAWRRLLLVVVIMALVLGSGALFMVRQIYTNNLRPVNAASKQQVVVAIPSGSALREIAVNLQSKGAIRKDWAFEQYVRSHELGDKLKAGTYRLTTAQDVASIVEDLVAGKVAVDLFTILPGQRLDQIRQAFIKEGYDEASVDKALDPRLYANMPALVDKPADASLEGYLYPDSFQKTADTLPETIIRASLQELGNALKPELRNAFTLQGFNTYKAITLASIVEREVNSQADRSTAAQVFIKRLTINMQLGSDVTACYGAIKNKVMKPTDNCNNFVGYDSAYNTRIHTGLPTGPISNVGSSGLKAVAYPSSTDYLYFVAGDDGVTHFTKTNAEHEEATRQYCKKLCQ